MRPLSTSGAIITCELSECKGQINDGHLVLHMRAVHRASAEVLDQLQSHRFQTGFSSRTGHGMHMQRTARYRVAISSAPMLHSHSKFVLQIEQSLSLSQSLLCDFFLSQNFSYDCVRHTFMRRIFIFSQDCLVAYLPIYLSSFRWKVRRLALLCGDLLVGYPPL